MLLADKDFKTRSIRGTFHNEKAVQATGKYNNCKYAWTSCIATSIYANSDIMEE